MRGMFSWVYLLLFSSLLSANVGLGLVSRKVAVERYQLIILIFILLGLGYISSYFGSWLGAYITYRFLEGLFGLILIGCGVYILKFKPSYPGLRDRLLFYAVLVFEVCLVSYQYGHVERGGLAFVLVVILIHLCAVAGGMIIAGKQWTNWRMKLFYPHATGILFIVLGLIKLF